MDKKKTLIIIGVLIISMIGLAFSIVIVKFFFDSKQTSTKEAQSSIQLVEPSNNNNDSKEDMEKLPNISENVEQINPPEQAIEETNTYSTELNYYSSTGELYKYNISMKLPEGAKVNNEYTVEPIYNQGYSSRGELRLQFNNGVQLALRPGNYVNFDGIDKLYANYFNHDGVSFVGNNTQFGEIFRCYNASNSGYNMISYSNNIVSDSFDNTYCTPEVTNKKCLADGLFLLQEPKAEIEAVCFLSISDTCANYDLDCTMSRMDVSECDEVVKSLKIESIN